MMHPREFDTADVVTVTTGVLVSNRGIDAVYDVCNHVLGDSLWTHQLVAAATASRPHLLGQHPWLATLHPPVPSSKHALRAWIACIVAEHGPTLTVAPAEAPAWKRGNALADLVDQVGADRVIGIVIPEQADQPRPDGGPAT